MNSGSQSAGNQVEFAYLAAFIDADGCICLASHKRKSRNGKERIIYHPSISITQTCTLTADYLHNLMLNMGFGVYRQLRRVTQKGWTDRHHLEVTGLRRCLPVLKDLFPYFVTKQTEAKLLIEFIEHRLALSSHDPYGDFEDRIKKRMHAIKKNRNGELRSTRTPQRA